MTTADTRPTFRSTDIDERFSSEGYVVMDVLSPTATDRLRRRVLELTTGAEEGFEDSADSTDADYRRAVRKVICGALESRVGLKLTGHRPISSGILVKWPGPSGTKSVHQDWSLVDEARFRAVNVWVALEDMTPANGGMALLPGSHRMLDRPRPAPGFPLSYDDPLATLTPEDLVPIPMTAGQALFMDMATVHGSPQNQSPRPRVAVGLAFAPEDAELRFWFRHDDERLVEYVVPTPAFFSALDFRSPPSELEERRSLHLQPAPVTAEQLREHAAAVHVTLR